MTDRLFALIPAAGTGARMGTTVPKQYFRLGGQTMLEHAVDALLAAPDLEQVLVVVAPDDVAHQQLPRRARLDFALVGGATRAASVRNGLRVLRTTRHIRTMTGCWFTTPHVRAWRATS